MLEVGVQGERRGELVGSQGMDADQIEEDGDDVLTRRWKRRRQDELLWTMQATLLEQRQALKAFGTKTEDHEEEFAVLCTPKEHDTA